MLLRMGSHRILLDCGLRDLSPFPDPSEPPADVVLCSHAHSDHARSLLALHRAFPKLPIYASEVTTQLLPLNWLDEKTVPWFCQALPWRSPVEILENLTIQLFPAGHLPGAAAVLLTYYTETRPYRVLYTGDFFLSNARLVEGLKLEELRGISPDVLILEGSYGGARHPRRRQQENQLMERMERAIAAGQSILMPVSAFGLAQEVLMLLRSHYLFTGRDLDIWVDGQVAQGCDTYLELLPSLPVSVQNFARHQPLFWDDRVRPRVRRLLPEQRDQLGHDRPCIVLTDALAQLPEFCQPGTQWLVLLPQYQDLRLDWLMQESRGDQPDTEALVTVETYLLAEHSDAIATLQLIHTLRPQHLVLFHGSPTYLSELASLDELTSRYQVHTPAPGTLVDLPIEESFIQPEAPEILYEGELAETQESILVTLPAAMTGDPRWRNLSDTGVIEARWQGNDLVLRGVSQKELLGANDRALLETNQERCISCLHYRNHKCLNRRSPLYNFRVTPSGYCPEFERNPAVRSLG